MNYVAQIFGIGAMVCLFLIYQQTKRKNLILMKLGADICWVIHYLCLGAPGGMIPNFVGMFRECVFINREKSKWASNALWPVVFIVINWLLGIRTFKSPINILPICASTFVTISLWLRKPRLTKIISVPVSLAFLIYDFFVGSYAGMINETIAIVSIGIYFVKGEKAMTNIFSEDFKSSKTPINVENKPIVNSVGKITADMEPYSKDFAQEIEDCFVADFEKSEELLKAGKTTEQDFMCHVSTFKVVDDTIYMTYYANTHDGEEDPNYQTARLVYCHKNDTQNKTFLDIQTVGDECYGKKVVMVYDTILMQKDENTLYVLWTANLDGNYYRLYRPFYISEKRLGDIGVNRFKMGDITNDFSTSGIQSALCENGIGFKKMYSDIGIMQKLSTREENGNLCYYTGAYSGDFTCIIKSCDLVTWEYVSEPDFDNDSKWENATYVIGDKCFYFVRQHHENTNCGFLTVYDLVNKKWEAPLEVEDCQSRSDFIVYNGELYLFHAPVDREHIGIIKINTEDISKSEPVLKSHMHTSCFYPFIQYFEEGVLAMSYTVARKHIRLAKFTLSKYI